MLEKLYKKKAMILVLSAALGLSGCHALKESDFNDKYIVYTKENNNLSKIFIDENGKKLHTDVKVGYFIIENNIFDRYVRIIAVDETGKLYTGFIPAKFVSEIESINKEIKETPEKNFSLLKTIPGALYKYGPDEKDKYIEYFYDNEKSEITFEIKKINIMNEAGANAKVLTSLSPGDEFVLLYDEEIFYKNDVWNKVAFLNNNTIEYGYINKNEINLDNKEFFEYIKTKRLKH